MSYTKELQIAIFSKHLIIPLASKIRFFITVAKITFPDVLMNKFVIVIVNKLFLRND